MVHRIYSEAAAVTNDTKRGPPSWGVDRGPSALLVDRGMFGEREGVPNAFQSARATLFDGL